MAMSCATSRLAVRILTDQKAAISAALNGVIAGHGRLEAAKFLGLNQVPTIMLEHMTEAQKRAYIIADNRLAEKGGWDKEILAIEFSSLIDLDSTFDLKLFDAEGQAMSPTHSKRPGKRYRYYLSQALVQNKPVQATTLTKIPAGEIERVLNEAVGTLLGDDARLMEANPDLTIPQRERARQWHQDWKGLSEVWKHTLVREVMKKVIVAADMVTCHICPHSLAAKLNGQDVNSAPTDNPLVITIPIRLKRIQGGPVLVLAKTSTSSPTGKLALAVAKAYCWNQKILTGKVASAKELAQTLGRDDRFIHRTLPLAWLAPSIVEALLMGQEPESLQLAQLLEMAYLP